MPSTTLTRGNTASNIVIQVTLTPAATNATTSLEQTFTIPGLQVATDQIGGYSFQGANAVLVGVSNVRVSANNTMGITFQNPTAGGLTFPAGSWLFEINRTENLPFPSNLA